MATRKTNKKVVDGFTKKTPSSAAKNASRNAGAAKIASTAKKISVKEALEEEPVIVSAEETNVTVIEADNLDGITPEEGLNSDAISEPETEEDALAAAIAGFADNEAEDGTTDATDTADATDTTDTTDNTAAADTTDGATTEEPLSAADITVAVNNPTEEEQAVTESDDIEALINDVSLEDPEDAKDGSKSDTNDPKRKEDPMKNAKKHAPKEAKPFRIISRILSVITTGALALLFTRVITTGALPGKYLWPALGVAAVFSAFFIFKAFRKKTHLKVLGILDFLSVLLIIASIFGFLKVDEIMRFLDKNLDSGQEYSIYNVIVSKKSNYNELSDVKGQTFHSISDFVDTEKLEKAAEEQAGSKVTYEDGITSLLKNTMNSTTYVALLNSGTYEAALETNEDNTYKNNLKVIGEIKVATEKNTRDNTADLTKNSFLLYISGIDTRSGMMVDRSLSDVNIVMAVNPNTKNILMVAVPRDYYVQLHGTSGLPDKLTHAGSLGGVELSMSTIEDLLSVKFNHYLRVNFNAVVNLVDAVGGITVYSDVDYNITAHTNSSCVFRPGNNDVNGACALAFARERYAYASGDRHRGENQEQVIEKIFNKLTSSSTLISKYSDILNALSGSFETSLATSDITSLVNMQLSNMSKWTITSYNLNGSTGPAYTYSYPSQQLSVMFPDQSTIDTAKQKLTAVLTGTAEAK